MIAREAWQHTLTCELRRRRPTGPPGALPRWQHTLTCELRHEDEATAQAIIDLATYAYVRVATEGEATRALINAWQHTLTCELRLAAQGAGQSDSTGNIRLRASCDTFWNYCDWKTQLATYAYVRVATELGAGDTLTLTLATYAYVRVATLSDRFRYQVTLRFICVWTSVQNGFSNSVSVSRRRTRTGHCSLRHFLPPCFAFEVRGFGRLGHALPL